MAEAAAKPTHAQMIAEMQKAGYNPQQAAAASPDQMIQEMQAAGYTPQPDAPAAPQEDNSQSVLGGWGSTVGGVVGAVGGAIAGAAGGVAVAGPPGAAYGAYTGEVAGAGIGAAAGKAGEDYMNNYFLGKNKSNMDIAKDAALEGGETAGLQAIGALAVKGVVKAGVKFAEAVAPRAAIERWAQFSSDIKELWKSGNSTLTGVVEQAKNQANEWISTFTKQANTEIDAALSKAKSQANPTPALNTLRTALEKADPEDKAAKAQIEGLMQEVRVRLNENQDGISIQDANFLKQKLWDIGYNSDAPVAVKSAARQAGNAVKTEMNTALRSEGLGNVAEANNRLHTMLDIKGDMTDSLLNPDARNMNPFLAAGKDAVRGTSAGDLKILQRLSAATGQDFVGLAQNAAAADTFLAPSNSGGKNLLHGGMDMLLKDAPKTALKYGAPIVGKIPESLRAVGSAVVPPTAGYGAGTLGEAVMHGSGAIEQLREIGK